MSISVWHWRHAKEALFPISCFSRGKQIHLRKHTLYREKIEEKNEKKNEILYLSGRCKACHYIDFDLIYNMSSSLHDVGYNLTTHDDTMYLRYDIRSKTQVIKKKVWNEYFTWRSKEHGLPHT